MERLQNAIRLRKEGKLEESNTELLKLVDEYPNNAVVNYQCAWSFDVLGLESSAVQYYEKALLIGLEGEDLHGAFLGLGSTYRTLGKYEKSKAVFERALSVYLQDAALKTFYAMTLYNLKEYSNAMQILLINLAQTSSDENLKQYKKAIEFYSDKLDKVW